MVFILIQTGVNSIKSFASPLIGRERLHTLQTSNQKILDRIKELQLNIEENERQVKSNLTELDRLQKHTKTANLFQAEFQKIVNVAGGCQSLATEALVGILKEGVYCVSQRRNKFGKIILSKLFYYLEHLTISFVNSF